MFSSFHKVLAFAFVFSLCQTVVTGKPSPSRFRRHKLRQRATAPFYNTTYTSLEVELPVDHFGGNAGTFMNRYWVDARYYKPGGPVIIDDNGESDAQPAGSDLEEDLAWNTAKATGGLLISWEHRYYGKSLPDFDPSMINNDTALANWYQYLTVEQALEDFVTFASNFSYAGLSNVDLTPGSTPWIFTGTSYPGARAAWIRQRNPDVVYISLASSGPVQVQADFHWYSDTIREYLMAHGYSNCTADLHSWVAWAGDLVASNNTADFKKFVGKVNSYLNNSTLTASLPTPNDILTTDDIINTFNTYQPFLPGEYQDTGVADTLSGMGLSGFCNLLQSVPVGSAATQNDISSAAADGNFAAFGQDAALNIVAEAVASMLTSNAKLVPPQPQDNSMQECLDGNKNSCAVYLDANSISWNYQWCTEMGFEQIVDSSDPLALYPSWETETRYQSESCLKPNSPSEAPEKKYGGFKGVNPSNTLFADGQWDPWRKLSLNSPHNTRKATSVIPKANETPSNGSFFGYIVDELFHGAIDAYLATVSDFRNGTFGALDMNASLFGWEDTPDQPAVTSSFKGQQLWLKAVTTWLPAFKKHAVTSPVISKAPGVGCTQSSLNSTSPASSQCSSGPVPSSTSGSTPVPTPSNSKSSGKLNDDGSSNAAVMRVSAAVVGLTVVCQLFLMLG